MRGFCECGKSTAEYICELCSGCEACCNCDRAQIVEGGVWKNRNSRHGMVLLNLKRRKRQTEK
jgi:hypothetical protein